MGVNKNSAFVVKLFWKDFYTLICEFSNRLSTDGIMLHMTQYLNFVYD